MRILYVAAAARRRARRHGGRACEAAACRAPRLSPPAAGDARGARCAGAARIRGWRAIEAAAGPLPWRVRPRGLPRVCCRRSWRSRSATRRRRRSGGRLSALPGALTPAGLAGAGRCGAARRRAVAAEGGACAGAGARRSSTGGCRRAGAGGAGRRGGGGGHHRGPGPGALDGGGLSAVRAGAGGRVPGRRHRGGGGGGAPAGPAGAARAGGVAGAGGGVAAAPGAGGAAAVAPLAAHHGAAEHGRDRGVTRRSPGVRWRPRRPRSAALRARLQAHRGEHGVAAWPRRCAVLGRVIPRCGWLVWARCCGSGRCGRTGGAAAGAAMMRNGVLTRGSICRNGRAAPGTDLLRTMRAGRRAGLWPNPAVRPGLCAERAGVGGRGDAPVPAPGCRRTRCSTRLIIPRRPEGAGNPLGHYLAHGTGAEPRLRQRRYRGHYAIGAEPAAALHLALGPRDQSAPDRALRAAGRALGDAAGRAPGGGIVTYDTGADAAAGVRSVGSRPGGRDRAAASCCWTMAGRPALRHWPGVRVLPSGGQRRVRRRP